MKPADVSGKRANRAMGAVSPNEKAAAEHHAAPPRRRIPAELDVQVFVHRVGLTEDDRQSELLSKAQRAYGAYATTLQDVYDREKTIRADQSRTAQAHALDVSKVAERALSVADRVQPVRDGIEREVSKINSQIEHETRSRMAPEDQREIRDYVRNLPTKQRREFLAKADDDTVAAVLAGKPYLSNLGPAEAESLRHNWQTAKFPEQVKLRGKLERARELLDAGWSRYMAEVTPLRDPDADQIQERMNAADQAIKASFEVD